MHTILQGEWPWYVAGPLIGLFVPALLLAGNKVFGVSANLSHICAAIAPARLEYFRYDWRRAGLWNLLFLAGVAIGGFVAYRFGAHDVAISAAAKAAQERLGIHDFSGLAPRELFTWHALLTVRGLVPIVGGGALVGFGTAYAAGCTSGHAISGLSGFQLPSLIAVLGFFAGGLAASWLLLPLLLGGSL
ncbi:MAG: YeeE/YedE thiosulfate transporter family protein [Terracidiphilus sp.]